MEIVTQKHLWGPLWGLLLSLVLCLGGIQPGYAQENRLGFGADLGLWAGTVDDTDFALGFNLDYHLDRAFSLGPMVLFSPAGNHTQIAVAGVGRFHIDLRPLNIVPFAGIGFVNSDFEVGPFDRNATSFYIPLGVTVELPLNKKISAASTLIVNIHSLNYDPPIGRDHTSVALMFGFRFNP